MARKLEVQIVGNTRDLERALGRASTSASKFGHTMGTVLKAGALAAGAGLVAVGIGLDKSIKVAEEAQVSQAKLATAYRNSGISLSAYTQQIDDAEAAGRRLGFTDAETRDSLATLIGPAGDTSKAIQDMALAEDLARFKHMDLATATKTLVSVMAGNARALKSVGLNIPPVTTAVDALKRSHADLTTVQGRAELQTAKLADAQKTAEVRLAALTDRIHGQAAAFSGTGAGAIQRFHAEIQHLEATIGDALLPIIDAVITKLTDWIDALNRSAQFHRIVADTVKGLQDAWKAAMGVIDVVKDHWGQLKATVKDTVDFVTAHKAELAPAAAAVGAVVAVATAYQVLRDAIAGATAAQALFNLAVEANPYVLVATAIAAAVAAL